jgi:transposase-like protein
MSTTPKKNTAQSIRYTAEQKKEIVDFVVSYNAANGRGGQTAAVNKFNVSPISVAAWMKGAGAPKTVKASKTAKAAKAPKVAKAAKAPKAEKAEKAPKVAKAPKTAAKVGTRYTAEEKQEVVDFVANYNAENGRGGQSKAAAKFGVSPITVMAWLKAAGVKKSSAKALKTDTAPAKAAKGTKTASVGSDAKLGTLLALIKEIATAEAALAQLNGKFRSLQASL